MNSRPAHALIGLAAGAMPLVTVGAAIAGWPISWIVLVGLSAAVVGTTVITLTRGRLVTHLQELSAEQKALSATLEANAEALAKADRRYARLLSGTDDSVIIVDTHGKIIEANEPISTVLGLPPTELPGHFLPDLASATERQHILSFISEALDTGKVSIQDLMLNQQDGEAAWFNGTAIKAGEETDQVQIVLKDITATKRQFILSEKEIAFIHELSRTLPLLQDFDQMLERILGMLGEALHYEGFALVLAEPNDTIATIYVGDNPESGFIENIKDCVKEVLSDLGDEQDAADIEFALENKQGIDAGGETVGSQIMLPLAVVNGVAGLFSSKEDAFKKEDLSLFSTMVSGISSLYIAYKSYQQVQHLSITDPLTGLYNRRKFFEDLEREVARIIRYESPLALIMLDIDHFKAVNDRFGHQMGDEVLKEVAEILRENTRKTDVVARYGGEEFILLLTETPLEGATLVASRIREAIEKVAVLGADIEIKFTASLGVGVFQEGDTTDTFVAHADAALYRAKDNGRNRIELVDV